MKRILFLAVIVLISFGCAKDNSTTPDGEQTTIRLLHMAYDVGALDLRVNGNLVTSGTTFGTTSGYTVTTPGELMEISIHDSGDVDARISVKRSIAVGSAHTMYAFPPNNAFSAAFTPEERNTTPEKARIKLVNASPDPDTFQLHITASSSKLLGPIGRSKYTDYADLEAGTYRFSLRNAYDTSFSIEYEAVTLLGQGAYTIVIHGTQIETDPYDFGIRMFTDNGTGTDFIDWVETPSTAKISFVNSVEGSNVHVSLDGTIAQIQYLSYPYPSKYLTVASGTHTFSVVNGTTVFIANQNFSLDPFRSYTQFITGTRVPPNIAPLLLQDQTDVIPGMAYIRFVNCIPDSPPLAVYLKDVPTPGSETLMPGMESVSFREYRTSTTDPRSVTFRYKDANADTTLFESSAQSLNPGKIYTIWVGGSKSTKTMKSNRIDHN